jgi:aldose 1-epimerase
VKRDAQNVASTRPAAVDEALFGILPDGRPVRRFTLRNGDVSVDAIEFGAIITSLRTPDHLGHPADVVLGFDTLDGYLGRSPYFGAVVGRCANRIAGGRFTLDGVTYQLACNDGANHLHGGWRGFDKALWRGEPIIESGAPGVAFTYVSADREEGYPGRLAVRVVYTLAADGALVVRYRATCDATTIINLSQHSYFNLSGSANDVLDHVLAVNASRFTPVDGSLIPTGALQAVAGTPFDFRIATPIGARIAEPDDQLAAAGGYDHNFVLDREGDEPLVLAARVLEPVSRRTLEVRTTQPGLQFYSGNFLDGSITGKNGRRYGHRAGFCLETQHFPDSPNHPGFPSVVLEPGREYAEETEFRFGVATG